MQMQTKRQRALAPGDVIVIDRGGSVARVISNSPDPFTSRALGMRAIRFLMDDGREGGWVGRGDSVVDMADRAGVARMAAVAAGGAR